MNAELRTASIADNRASNARRDGQPCRSHSASSLADQNLARPTCDGAGIAPKSSNRRSVVRDTLNKRATSIGRNSNRFSGSDSATGTFGEHLTGGNRNLSKSTIAKTLFIESLVGKMPRTRKFRHASGEARRAAGGRAKNLFDHRVSGSIHTHRSFRSDGRGGSCPTVPRWHAPSGDDSQRFGVGRTAGQSLPNC